ncbi:tenascin-R-like [Megalops cyprinoides]|uniref:tenascin-R-like n=1 Tax=Megalops cyprinoides TaxID=118141 RepID=UPI001864A2A1|nr:tenascin-R-like [Megalops cyprinoides]
MSLAGDRKLLPRLCEEHHAFVCQGASPPGKVEVGAVGTDFVSLRWDRPAFMESVPHSFNISYTSSTGSSSSFISPSNSTLITSLQPGEQYTFSISTVTETVQSLPACVSVTTHLEAPVGVRIDSIFFCVSVSWADPGRGSHTAAQYNISYSSLHGHHSGFILTLPFCSHMTITGLLPQTEYMLNITAVNESGASSLPVTVFLFTSAPAITVVAMVLRGLQCVFLGLFFWLLCHFHWKRNYDVESTSVETTEEMFFTPQEV